MKTDNWYTSPDEFDPSTPVGYCELRKSEIGEKEVCWHCDNNSERKNFGECKYYKEIKNGIFKSRCI